MAKTNFYKAKDTYKYNNKVNFGYGTIQKGQTYIVVQKHYLSKQVSNIYQVVCHTQLSLPHVDERRALMSQQQARPV